MTLGQLERAVASGTLSKPKSLDPLLELLWARLGVERQCRR